MDAGSSTPDWAYEGEFVSITRTADEVSIVCRSVPENVPCERGWRCLKVRGPLDFSLTGVLSSIAKPLADAAVPIFAISTFDTDYILVFEKHLPQAINALKSAGHSAG
ncbi:MAG: ACT domain-containing protein [Acidobacteriia bacterium]|nr:ACT domain-containing protein [Terriglobia bacterium]